MYREATNKERNSLNHLKLIVPFLLLTISAGCAKPGLRGVKPYWSELSEANREIHSRQLSPSRNLFADKWKPALDRAYDKIVGPARTTCRAVGGSNCTKVYTPIEIVNDPAINASVDATHNIRVYAGLLTHAGSDEEIAVVLAHEYGHIFARHIEKQQQNAGLGMLVGGAIGIAIAAKTGIDVTKESMEVGSGAGALAYSPESELEADYYAALILENSGIDLDYGRDLLIRLTRTARSGGTRAGAWGEKARLMATTHPADDLRIARWLSVSRSIEDGRRLDSQQTYDKDSQLRRDALDRLLDNLIEETTRWVNSRNGHSGTLFFKDAKYEKECALSCIQIEQVDHVQERQIKSWRWLCKVKGNWIPKDSLPCEVQRQ